MQLAEIRYLLFPSAISPHRGSLNKLRVNMNNVSLEQPMSSSHWLLPSRTTVSRPPPLLTDWSDAGECDVEFDRLISGRGSFKGGTDDMTVLTGRERYKERLQNKYLKVPTNTLSKVNSCWCFVNVRSFDELNDSSPNLPGAQRDVSPVNVPNITSNQTPQKGISKRHACFSKQMIQKQIRREYVAGLEEKLTQHPLALYPHYKDHMSPELFDKVASVLDPDMCVSSSSALPTPALGHVEEEEVENFTEPTKEEANRAKQETPASKMQVH
ncbi:hypothetical protein PAMA_018039 [Pampus argenteus]